MRQLAGIGIVLLALGAAGGVWGGEPVGGEPGRPCFLERFHPAGGWCPDGGGLLHWWNPHCFPCGGAPDDYCRKKQPNVCWPPYPPYYIYGTPPACAGSVVVLPGQGEGTRPGEGAPAAGTGKAEERKTPAANPGRAKE
jgi:hypothetical protein